MSERRARVAPYTRRVFDRPFTVGVPLEGAIDVDAVVRTIPSHYTVKGMFCKRFAELLGSGYSALALQLEAPAPAGKYVAFHDYPQADYTRIVVAASSVRFPGLPAREAVRRIAREDMAIFAKSMFGRVVLAFGVDARNTLHRVPDAYTRIAPGTTVHTVDLDARTVQLEFEHPRGLLEYVMGQLEGIVLHFGAEPITIVRRKSIDTVAFEVAHGTLP